MWELVQAQRYCPSEHTFDPCNFLFYGSEIVTVPVPPVYKRGLVVDLENVETR